MLIITALIALTMKASAIPIGTVNLAYQQQPAPRAAEDPKPETDWWKVVCKRGSETAGMVTGNIYAPKFKDTWAKHKIPFDLAVNKYAILLNCQQSIDRILSELTASGELPLDSKNGDLKTEEVVRIAGAIQRSIDKIYGGFVFKADQLTPAKCREMLGKGLNSELSDDDYSKCAGRLSMDIFKKFNGEPFETEMSRAKSFKMDLLDNLKKQ